MNGAPTSPAEPQRTPPQPIWVFTASRTDPKILEAILVQRHQLLGDAVERVRESGTTGHKHHLLFVGPRGCGKTHLVTLIVSRISADTALADRLHLAWLNEDETCTTLLELLLKIYSALQKRYPSAYPEATLEQTYERKPKDATEYLGQELLAALGARTLLVVTENLDAIFEGLGDAGQKELRAFIQEHPRLCLVATAQRLVEDLSDRKSPFFGFFQTEHLKPLKVGEASELLLNIARVQGKDSLVEFLDSSRGRSRIRALHHLSGGNHRIYIVLSQFITRESMDALLPPFLKMVDELTPYYQERIRWLPTLQRKIVEFLCTCENTVPVKEIARRLFATPQTISGQLQDLREKGYVDSNQRGRESLYEITEPLMRICVEVKEIQSHEPLRLIVDFLRVWYDEPELKRRLAECDATSQARSYLESAIRRNSVEGNLRKQIFLKDLRALIPPKMGETKWEEILQELDTQPEAIALSAKNWLEGNKSEARMCLDEALAEEPDPASKVALLASRAQLQVACGEPRTALADYTALIEIPEVPVGELAKALVSRGKLFGQIGDASSEINDYTRVVALSGAPPKQVAMALVNRGITLGKIGETQREIEDYTSAIEIREAPADEVAKALLYRGISFGEVGKRQEAIDDYTTVIQLADAPVELIGRAYLNRGVTYAQLADRQHALSDCRAVVDLHGAPVEDIVNALFNSGILHQEAGETDQAIVDYTAALSLPGISNEQSAKAHLGRGFALAKGGRFISAIDDYTLMLKFHGLPDSDVAAALLNRSVALIQLGDIQRALDDCSAVVGLSKPTVEQVGSAHVGRGIFYTQLVKFDDAIREYTTVIALPGVPAELSAMALFNRGLVFFVNGRKAEARKDLEALVHSPGTTEIAMTSAYYHLSALHISEGEWAAGFQMLEEGLRSGANEQSVQQTSLTNLIQLVFSTGLISSGRREKLAEFCRIHQQYQALTTLGEGVITHLGEIFRKGAPFPATDNLEDWYLAWEEAAKDLPDFRLTLRLLRTGIAFLQAGGQDRGILLDLTAPERRILEQTFGFPDSGEDTSK